MCLKIWLRCAAVFHAAVICCAAVCFAAAALFCGAVIHAQEEKENENQEPKLNLSEIFGWHLLFSGSLDESISLEGTLNSRTEARLYINPADIFLRAQVLDRRPLNLNPENFQWENLMGDPQKQVTNFTGGVYHKATGSRFLYGVIDESGLSARIRNPWIRSPAYTENHNPSIAELKTSVSVTGKDELYLYLSSPDIKTFNNIKLKGFISAQTESGEFTPALSGGVKININKNINMAAEIFFTQKVLQPYKPKTWFSDPPPLPERDFRLTAAAFLFECPGFSVSSDFAASAVFAHGAGIYANLGVTITPLLPFESIASLTGRERPLSISFAADGAEKRFVYRDGADHGEGFRTAVKIEWKSRYSSLIKAELALRGHGFGGDFYSSASDFYYRFPSSVSNSSDLFRPTVISLSADRNAKNIKKISDTFKASIGFRFNPWKSRTASPFGFTFSGSIKGLTASDGSFFLLPVPDDSWHWSSSSIKCELTWSPDIFQFRFSAEYINFAEKDDIWDISASASIRLKYGRIGLSITSPDFPEKWSFSLSWRLELNSN